MIGAGRFGTHLAARLSEFGCEIVIADKNGERVEDLVQDGFYALVMDAEDQDSLEEGGVQEVDAVVVSIGENMQGSILATLLLKELKVKKLVGRALHAKHSTVLERLGEDLVVLPTRDMAYRLAGQLRDNIGSDRQQLSEDYQLAQIRVGAPLHDKTLAEAAPREHYCVNIVLLARANRAGKSAVLEPSPERVIRKGDMLFVAGWRANLNRFERENREPLAAN